MNLGLSVQRKPARSLSSARVAKTAVKIEITVLSKGEQEREAAHTACGDREQDHGGDRGDDVRVDDRREPLAIAGRNGGTDRLTFRRLFLDAFEDDDVRVGRDPDREDHAREARQRQRDEQQDDGVEEREVEREADDRDKAEEPVDEQQEERDNRKPDERRRGSPRAASPSRALRRPRSGRSARTPKAPGLQDERSVLGLADVADPRDLGAAARDAIAVVPVDRRRHPDLAVEDDREALERLLLRYALVRDLLPRARPARE